MMRRYAIVLTARGWSACSSAACASQKRSPSEMGTIPPAMNRQVAFGFGMGVLATSVLIGCLTAQRPASPRPQQAAMATSAPKAGVRGPGVPEFWVRPGYRVDLVAENLGNARFMEFDDKGTLYLSRPQRGDILALRLRGNRYEVVNTFIEGYPTVHGMHFADGWLAEGWGALVRTDGRQVK